MYFLHIVGPYVLCLLWSVTMLYLKKVIFFEDLSDRTRKIVGYMLLGQLIYSTIAVILNCVGFSSIIMWVPQVLFMVVPVVYSSFVSRNKRKWFAFVIPLPLFMFTLAFYNIALVAVSAINAVSDYELDGNVFNAIFFSVFVGLICILRMIPNSPMWKLERYGEMKSLMAKEDMYLCIAAFILGISMVLRFIEANNLLAQTITMIYSFILAVFVMFAVYSANGRHYFESQSHELQMTLIRTMADLVENRDENTGGHIRRTAKYVEVIAEELMVEGKFPDILTEQYVKDMIVAAPLHDIGKIHVPDAILGKPGKLTEEEFTQMKTHTTAGYDIIVQVEKQSHEIEYIKVAKQMARSHHEWMSGKGYPDGLKGNEIPLCAKILAVADVFDALVSKRCYKEPMPLEKAYEIMRSESGTHFDEDVLNAFFAARDKIETVLQYDGE